MAQKMKINFTKNPQIVYLDTYEPITHERVKEFWEMNHEDDGEPCPEEHSDKWYDIARMLKDDDLDDFKSNMQYAEPLGLCLVSGSAGLWNGRHEGGNVIEVNDFDSLTKCVDGCDDIKVFQDKDGLHVHGYHHDGTNCYLVQPLSKKGEAYWHHHEEQTRAVHEHLKSVKGYLKKVSSYLF